MCCCIAKHKKRFFDEKHVAKEKHQKGIEKGNIFFCHVKSYFLKNEVTLPRFLSQKKWP